MLETRQPKEMYLLAITEMCQRFAFGGIAYLLVLYLVQFQMFTDSKADQLFGMFTGAAFLLPIIGGYIGDRVNHRLPVIWGIFLTALGCFLMATSSKNLLYPALICIATGSGIFTPNIYALLGSLYHNKQHLREGGFSIYYSAVNAGAFIALVLLGFLGQSKLWNFGFFIAGCVQLIGFIFFRQALKSPLFKCIPKTGKSAVKPAPLHKHEKKRILVICILSLFSIFFWMAYNQGGSSLNLFALRYTDRSIMGFEIPPSWLLSSETLYLILFAFPLAAFYKFLVKRKKDPTPPMKSAYSLVAMGVCFAIMAIGSRFIPPGAQTAAISPSYLFVAYAFMALGEMLIAPIGLALITHISPHRLTALLVGVWYLCIGIAFYLGGAVAPWMSKLHDLSSFFDLFVVISFVGAAILFIFVKKLNRMRHLDSL